MAAKSASPELARVITWLLDTGPVVAYLDGADPAHEKVVSVLDPFRGHLVTTSAVVTEAMHFVSSDPTGPRALTELIRTGPVTVYDLSRTTELEKAVVLTEKYADTPMDFADATLVLLAESLECLDILTLDRRGFAAYRTRGGHPLRLVLDF